MTFPNEIKLHPVLAGVILIALAIAIFFSVSLVGGLWQKYRESRFTKQQAALEQQNQQAKAEKDAALQRAQAAENDKLAAQKQLAEKENETKQLESQLADLQRTTEARRQTYNSIRNQRVPVRPVGSGVSDAELRADAVRLGLVIR